MQETLSTSPSTPLLTYAFTASPDPLAVSSPASLMLTVDNNTGSRVTCQQIAVTLPLGVNAQDLIASPPATVVPPDGWTVTQDGGVSVLTPPAGCTIFEGGGLIFVFAITTNDQPGPTTVTIAETASDPANPLLQRSTQWTTAKFPADFSLSALTAVPFTATDIAYGETAQLTWTATGAGVSCTLDYQPANSGTPVSASVPNTPDGGIYTTEALTRGNSVTFTLIAQVTPPGQDQPLTLQSQLGVSVEALTLALVAEPPAVGPNGLVRLTWTTNNADHCTDENGNTLAANGSRFVVLQATHDFVINAFSDGQQIAQQSRTITVDPSIVATESGDSSIGTNGADFTRDPPGDGQSVTLTLNLPPLDTTDHPARVIPLTVTGGNGGLGTTAAPFDYDYQFAGGTGGNASLVAQTDAGQGAPAQFLITVTAGTGGMGSNGERQEVQAPSGTVTATFDGIAIELP